MSEAEPLSEFFRVRERFHRSVNVSADYLSGRMFDDYILTSLSKSLLTRIGEGLGECERGRSWSITGPYGAGKSAFALFAAQLLGYPINEQIRGLVGSKDPELMQRLYARVPGLSEGGYLVIPIVGTRAPLQAALLAGLTEGLVAQADRISGVEESVAALVDLGKQAAKGAVVSDRSMGEALHETVKRLRSSASGVLGVLIICDELGRALEHASLHPEDADIGILQTIAELADRSERAAVGLITILHQAFEHYAANLSVLQQREWSKVQGRFEDMAFLLSHGEFLAVVDSAISRLSPPLELDRLIAEEVAQAETLDLLPGDLDRSAGRRILAGCAPLHPTVSLVLARLFRSRLSQNERSLFAFLTSSEPHGLQEYLGEEAWSRDGYRPFYRIDNLYDYVSGAMGSVLYATGRGKRWAEIEDALDRLPPDSARLDGSLVKAIGLLGLLGDQRNLKASEMVLRYSLANGQDIDAESVRSGLDRLESWGLVVHRGFKDAYGLWQGSDIDLDERFDQGVSQIDRSQSLASVLKSRGEVKPYVAKRHLHETGTFRHFVPWIIHLEELEGTRDRPYDAADGAIVFVMRTAGEPEQQVISELRRFSAQLASPRRDLLLYGVPRQSEGIREAFEELLVWEWVRSSTPELEGDAIARRELAARHLAAKQRVGRVVRRSFDPTLAYRTCRWVWAGEEQEFASARDLSSFVSDACDLAYHAAPIVKNELVNRRRLSSAAAAARRKLIERMITDSTEARLGMHGYPPEVSMYLSVLHRTGVHQQDSAGWVFGPPREEDPCRLSAMWEAIDGFLATTQEDPRAVTELFEMLREPPFGIRDGLLPIHLVAAILHWEAQVAAYEEGSFVPTVTPAVCERLMRVPQRFSLQRFELDETGTLVLRLYSELFGDDVDPRTVSILTAVRPIMSFASQLPRYTQLTESLTEDSIRVRDALLSAREPQRLLLETLPHALGLELEHADARAVQQYFLSLKRPLLELQDAYDNLLLTIEAQMLDDLLLPSDLEQARQQIALRARLIERWVGDLPLKALALRLSDSALPRREWLESVAAVVVNKPPRQWNDADVLSYRVALAEVAGRFQRTEDVVLSSGDGDREGPTGRVMRLSVTDEAGREDRGLARVLPERQHEVQSIVATLLSNLQEAGVDRATAIVIVAELAGTILGGRDAAVGADE